MFAKEVYVLPIIAILRTTWAVRTEAHDLLELEAQVQDPDQVCADATAQKLIKEYEKGGWKVDQVEFCAMNVEELESSFLKHNDAAACASTVEFALSDETKNCAASGWASEECPHRKKRYEAWLEGVKSRFCAVELREYDECVRAAATAAFESYAKGQLERSRETLCSWTTKDVRHTFSDFLDISQCGTFKAYFKSCEESEGDTCDRERAQSRYLQWVKGVHADFCSRADTGDDSVCVGALAAKLRQSYKAGGWQVTKADVCPREAAEMINAVAKMEKSYNRQMAGVPECVFYREFRSSEKVSECRDGNWQGAPCEAIKKRATDLLVSVHTKFCEP